MTSITDFNNPFDAIQTFEFDLAEYTGAPYAVAVDCCTHAIELCLRYIGKQENRILIPAHTYLSIPMTFQQLLIQYQLIDKPWKGEYNFGGTNIWDSARLLTEDMYRAGQMQCLSFGHTKPMEIGRGGAILLDDEEAYKWFKLAVYDGRNLRYNPWETQKEFNLGFHYMMRPEECCIGIDKLYDEDFNRKQDHKYPDLREITINS
jgi:dTDP-4-amino-4,6-dideoxygalactose transaminase